MTSPLDSFRKNHIQRFSDQTQTVREDLNDCTKIAHDMNKSSENSLRSLKEQVTLT